MGILWIIEEHRFFFFASVRDTSIILFADDQFIVGNVDVAHFLCSTTPESGKLYSVQ
jgi:hypothetical protein